MINKHLVVRAYGILRDPEGRILVSDEFIYGRRIVKLPGGGLEHGEGLAECVVREFVEETGELVVIESHFYTTDFFVQSVFNPEHQIISVYFNVSCPTWQNIRTSNQAFGYANEKEGAQSFRWVGLSDITEDFFSLPIERCVAAMLKEGGREN